MSETIRFDLNDDEKQTFQAAREKLKTVRLGASAIMTIAGVTACSSTAVESVGVSSEPLAQSCRVVACNAPFASCDGEAQGNVVHQAEVAGQAVHTKFPKKFIACNAPFVGAPATPDASASCVEAKIDSFVACNAPFAGEPVPSHTEAVTECVKVRASAFVACNAPFEGPQVAPPQAGSCVEVQASKFVACNAPFEGAPVAVDPATVGECQKLTCETPNGQSSFVACNAPFGA
jgi:hypothetical protein